MMDWLLKMAPSSILFCTSHPCRSWDASRRGRHGVLNLDGHSSDFKHLHTSIIAAHAVSVQHSKQAPSSVEQQSTDVVVQRVKVLGFIGSSHARTTFAFHLDLPESLSLAIATQAH